MMTRDEAEAAARKGAKVRQAEWYPGVWVTFTEGAIFDDQGNGYRQWDWAGQRPDGWSIVEPAQAPVEPGNAWHDLVIPGIVKVGDRVRVSWVTQEGDTKHLFHVGDVCQVGLGSIGSGPHYLAVQTRHGGFIAPRGDRVTFKKVEQAEPDLAARVAELTERMDTMERKHETRLVFMGWDLAKPGGDKTVKWPVPYPSFRTSRKPDASGVMGDEEIADTAVEMARHNASTGLQTLKPEVFAARQAIRLTRQSVRAQLAANEDRAVEVGMQVMNDEGYSRDAIRAALAAIREGL